MDSCAKMILNLYGGGIAVREQSGCNELAINGTIGREGEQTVIPWEHQLVA
jgi:hypothetical protein